MKPLAAFDDAPFALYIKNQAKGIPEVLAKVVIG